jgi:23S rRNA (cytosine1962-C5)-methyltransferase
MTVETTPSKTISLKRGKEDALQRLHPWIFSGAIARMEGAPQEGDLVRVTSAQGKGLAVGYYGEGSIAVRILSFDADTTIDADFWLKTIQNAFQYRQKLHLTDNPETNCYRLIHGEGDGVSGLIVDIYGVTAVIQCHSLGIFRFRQAIADAVKQVLGERITAIFDKSNETLPPQYATTNEYLLGENAADTATVMENGLQFAVNWRTGQKTGFFLDQRDNRALLHRYAADKTVLNAFCYSGGFSVYALEAGAKSVVSVDVSAKAIDLTEQNVALNPHQGEHRSEVADVLAFLKQNEQVFEVMIVDPPAFAKSIAKKHNAVQAYKRLNAMALAQIASGGILFTFSCSQVVDRELFYHTIVAAAMEVKRNVRVMHHLTQPADHPVSAFHPEGAYLKGLVLYVD